MICDFAWIILGLLLLIINVGPQEGDTFQGLLIEGMNMILIWTENAGLKDTGEM